jgi:hypothetical protein
MAALGNPTATPSTILPIFLPSVFIYDMKTQSSKPHTMCCFSLTQIHELQIGFPKFHSKASFLNILIAIAFIQVQFILCR